jgi:hypothetical protein
MATRSRPRSRSTDSPARIVEHEENNSSGPVTFPLWLTAPAAVGSPLAPTSRPLPPLLWSSRLLPRGGRRAFFRNFGEVLIVSPSLIDSGARTREGMDKMENHLLHLRHRLSACSCCVCFKENQAPMETAFAGRRATPWQRLDRKRATETLNATCSGGKRWMDGQPYSIRS